jgi:hypothetical protein
MSRVLEALADDIRTAYKRTQAVPTDIWIAVDDYIAMVRAGEANGPRVVIPSYFGKVYETVVRPMGAR